MYSEYEKIRVLKSCLEGPALDLYLALPYDEQGDLTMLEKTFLQHFRPVNHTVVETEAFVKMRKGAKQTVSEFYTALRKKANKLLIKESIVRITFMQGLDRDYQKHCVLQKANTLRIFGISQGI